MIKYSIRRQMTAIFIGLFSLILGLVLIINNAFLGHYYLSHKADDLIRTYNDVNAKLESGSLSDSDSVRDILTQLERANVDLVVVDGGGNAILTTLGESDPRLKEMFSGLFGMEGVDHENILKRNEDYTIYRDKSSQVQRDVEYLKMWGRFMDGSWFIMQCPYASITESASLANRFLIYLGCIGMVIGGLLVWMFSRSITRPIMELAGLSQEMANLNFDTKYTRGGMDEIGVLGNNFNKISGLQLVSGSIVGLRWAVNTQSALRCRDDRRECGAGGTGPTGRGLCHRSSLCPQTHQHDSADEIDKRQSEQNLQYEH